MFRKRMLAILFCLTVLLTGCQKSQTDMRLGTGGTGGNYYNYGLNLSEAVFEEDGKNIEVIVTEGSAANLRLMNKGYLDMALVQSDMLSDGLNGKGLFAEEKIEGIHAATGLYTESCQFIVSEESDIKSIYELAGKKISIGQEDSGAAKNALEILDACGIVEKVTIINKSFAESAEALKEGSIDGFFLTASAPTTAIVSLAEEMDIRILPMDENIALHLSGQESAYTSTVIPAGTYKNQEEDIPTIGVTAVLAIRDTVPAETEQMILDVLKNQNENLQEISFGVAAPKEPVKEETRVISFDMYMTLGLAVLVLFLGSFLRKRIHFLEAFCIPAPVVGGIVFAVVSCLLYVTGIMEFSFDETLKNICMMIFFTSVGFQANLKVLKKGGVRLVVFLLAIVVLIISQNALAVGIAKLLGLDPLVGMCTGSIPMVGGHGTSGAFGIVLEDLGLEGAITLCTASATFGLIMGSLMGGPIGRTLIRKFDLMNKLSNDDDSVLIEDEKNHVRKTSKYAPAAYQIAIAMGFGTIVSMLLSKTGMTFPGYIGAMIVAAIIRNVGEYTKKYTVYMGEINDLGGICLSLFLGIAMVTLKLWQLADLALPLFILLAAQTLFMALFAYFVVFNVMGRNYDAAILSAGTCGFGMGATPNAMANMQALTERFAPSVQAYILVPIVGSMFADFINSLVITFFINFI